MRINEAQIICFSPTRTSKQVAEAIVRGTGITNILRTEITHHPADEMVIPSSTLVVIVVPVYGGHVAPLAMERLEHIRGTNTPVALVVVYGNRAYEKALVELDSFAMMNGFKVIAGATFIGEHSYSSGKYPIAAGWPNKDDLQLAADFGKQLLAKVTDAADPGKLYPVDVNRIQRPKQSFFALFRFLRKAIALKKSGKPLPRTPWVEDENACTHCGACVMLCPIKAIATGDELNTDATKCIKCCACVKGCPHQARVFETPFAALLSQCFQNQKEPKTIL